MELSKVRNLFRYQNENLEVIFCCQLKCNSWSWCSNASRAHKKCLTFNLKRCLKVFSSVARAHKIIEFRYVMIKNRVFRSSIQNILLTRKSFNVVVTNEEVDNWLCCAICQDSFKLNDKVIELPCKPQKHYFHIWGIIYNIWEDFIKEKIFVLDVNVLKRS